jgi:CRP-like cAMP-binding protein
LDSVAAHPLAELLDCPPETAKLINSSSECLPCEPGQVVFAQDTECKGLYVVVSGQLVRRSERMSAHLTLGPVRAGELVELAAALGDGHHTYTLRAVTPTTLLLLPKDALTQAFDSYPLLRMHLLEELAREVSRAYLGFSVNRKTASGHHYGKHI